MADLSDFKGGRIAGVRMAGPFVTKTVELFGEAKIILLKVKRAFKK